MDWGRGPVSRILWPREGWRPFLCGGHCCVTFVLPDVRPTRSPDFRHPRAGALVGGMLTWPCCRWGLPCLVGHPTSGVLLPRRFTLTVPRSKLRGLGGLFSVALSVPRPRHCCHKGRGLAVSQHRCSGSSDFPHPCLGGAVARTPTFRRMIWGEGNPGKAGRRKL